MKYEFEDFELDLEQYQLRQRGEPQHLEPQVFDVLVYLVQNHQRLVPKQELLDHIWPESYITEAALNSRLMAARKAIGDSGREQRLIKTVHGRGYRFVGAVVESTGTPVAGPASAESGNVIAPEPGGAPLASDPPEAAPPPRPLSNVQPASPTTSFVGREAELKRIVDLLRMPECRLITVVGPGGVGKTRIAATTASRERERGTPVTYLSLETVYSEDDLPAQIAAAVGVQLQGNGTAAELSAGIADRDLLLVLDNVEQFAADGSELFETLVANNPGVRLLVTSRIVLGLREEWLCPVSGLSLEGDEGALPDAVRLFVARAHQAGSHIDTGEREQFDATLRICRLVDGMPLAIELAAALTRYMPLVEIANQIERDTEVLTVDLRNVPVRHRSVPGLMNESFRLLTVDQMRALLSLSVFEGSFSAEAANEVAEAPMRVLSALVDQSLVQPREGRFSLHPLLRQFCRERLGNSWGGMKDGHADYYTGFLEARRVALEQLRQAGAMREIDPEYPNIVAAWRWAAETGRVDLIGKATMPLSLYMQYRSRFVESAELLGSAMDAVAAAGADEWRTLADLQMAHAWALLRCGRGGQAAPIVNDVSKLYAEREERCGPGLGRDPRTAMALILWTTGDYDSAAVQARAAIDEARDKGDPIGEAFALFFAGGLILRMIEVECTPRERFGATYTPLPGSVESVEEAFRKVKRATEILEQTGDRWLLARVTSELTRSVHLRGDRRTAIGLLQRAIRLAEEFEDAATMAAILTNLADFHLDYGEPDLAEPFIGRAQALSRHLGDKGGTSEVERCLGRVHLARNEWEIAATHALTSIRLSQEVGFTNNILSNLRIVSLVLANLGDQGSAVELLQYTAAHAATTPFTRAVVRADLRGMGEPVEASDALRGRTANEMADAARTYLSAMGIALLSAPPAR